MVLSLCMTDPDPPSRHILAVGAGDFTSLFLVCVVSGPACRKDLLSPSSMEANTLYILLAVTSLGHGKSHTCATWGWGMTHEFHLGMRYDTHELVSE